MRFDHVLGIRGVSAWFPPTRESVEDQVRSGRLSPEAHARLGVTELPVSLDLAPPEMAVLAALKVLERTGTDPSAVGMVSHAWMYHQGREKWSVAHFVANQLGLPSSALPVGVNEMCNGGMTALYLSANALIANPWLRNALVTTADRFGPPVWDRWLTHTDIGYGDAATAAILHRQDGSPDELILRSLTYSTACWLEGMERGDTAFTTYPMEGRQTLDTSESRAQFYAVHGKESLGRSAVENVRATLTQALIEAHLEPDDPRIRLVTVPRLGPRLIDLMYIQVLESDLKAPLVQLGGRTGHLGAGDMLANFADLVELKLLAPGEIAVVCGAGGGFTWSTAIVQSPEA